MAVDRLRVEQNERVDLGDFQYQSDEGLNLLSEQTPGKLLTDPNGLRAWILDGFAIDNPSGNQVRVTKGRAILSRREGGVITHGVVVTEGDATKIIDTTSFTAVVHSIFVRFEYVDGDTLSRVFWDASSAAEFNKNVATRRKANWSMRIEQTNPGAEWLKIGEVDLSIGPSSITDQRPLYFEGVVSDTFANTWGSGTDRNATRAVDGIKDLQEFTAMVRTNFEQLRPVGARWWDERGLDVTGVASNEAGVTGRGSISGTSHGLEGFGSNNGVGAQLLGEGAGEGVVAQGGITGAGGFFVGGAGFGGVGVKVFAGIGSGANAIESRGDGVGAGMNAAHIAHSGVSQLALLSGVAANFVAALGQAAVVALGEGVGAGVSGTGGATSGEGLVGTGGAPNGIGVDGVSVGTGDAVRGISATGYALRGVGDTAAAPTRAALRINPQSSGGNDPTTAETGAIYFNSNVNQYRGYNGTDWARLDGNNVLNAIINTSPITTSGTYVLIPGMSVTIVTPGDYLIMFSGQFSHSSTNRIDFAIHVGAVVQVDTRRFVIPTSTVTVGGVIIALITGLNATDVVDIRWQTTGGTATVTSEREIVALQLQST